MEKRRFCVEGMSCAACVSNVTKAVSKVDGVKDVNVNLLTKSMDVEFVDNKCINLINKAVSKAGYKSYLEDDNLNDDKYEDKESKKMLKRLISSLIILIPLFYLSMGYMMNWPIFIFRDNIILLASTEMVLSLAILIINQNFFISGTKAVLHGGANMDTLVALGAGVSFIYGLVILIMMYINHENNEHLMHLAMNLTFETAGMVPTLITIGKTLESFSKGKTTNALKSLIDMRPKYANVIKDGKEMQIKASDVRIGDTFIVRAGEKIALDGIVIDGASSVDEAALTGESMPVDKEKGSFVYAATMNQHGTLVCEVKNELKDTTFSKIISLVEEVNATKAPISKIADYIAGIFVPIVLLIAVIIFVLWIIIAKNNDLIINEMPLTYAINRAIAVLVISCPCALGLATPVAIMVGSGKGAKMGILFKNGEAIEETGKTNIVVLDKTGTITLGRPSVYKIKTDIDEVKFIKLVASLEYNSSHPLAKSIVEYASSKDLELYDTCDFETLVGFGVKGKINNHTIYGLKYEYAKDIVSISNEYIKFIEEISSVGATPLVFVSDDKLIGVIGLIDAIKNDALNAVKEFKEMGIIPIMLTGDNKITAGNISSQVGIDQYFADLLPEDKQIIIKKLKRYGKVLMIGDGINDAVALSEANVGIAIGDGSDIAIDSSDIVLVKTNLMSAVKAIKLSRAILLNIKENLFWAFFYNIIMIPIAAGLFFASNIEILKEMKPWYGALAMSLSSVFVVCNALRLNLFNQNKKYKKKMIDLPNNFIENDLDNLKIELKVEGMMCEHCIKKVEDTCKVFKNVVSAKASLENKNVVIEYNKKIKIKKIKKAIIKQGYQIFEK